jgi:DNA-binding response OmpR family regulator
VALTGHTILVVEDEPLIAFDIEQSLYEAGALVLTAHTLADALRSVADSRLSAAVVDYRLNDGDSTELCERLRTQGLPFVVFTGYSDIPEVCQRSVVVSKPASAGSVVSALEGLLVPALRRA